ncbi:MAG: hypothetical protein R3B57_01125 [Phycisphaerales bacterium]
MSDQSQPEPDATEPSPASPESDDGGVDRAPAPSRGGGVAKWAAKRLVAHPFGKLAGVVVGALIGLAVQAGVQSTGVLGPGIDQLIDKQDSNFAALEAKLDELSKTDDPARAKELAKDIDALVAQQKSYAERAQDELKGARAELDRLKQDALEASGSAGGANLWLKPGESVTIAGKPGNVFAFNNLTYRGRFNDLTVNVSGKTERMIVGGHVDFPADNGSWRVIYKQSEARADGRVGFDVVFVPSSG